LRNAVANAYCYCKSNGYGDAHGHRNTDSLSHRDANRYGNAIGITNTYGNVDAQTHSDSETGSYRAASSYPSASAVMLADEGR
jgi:hypothetical protein